VVEGDDVSSVVEDLSFFSRRSHWRWRYEQTRFVSLFTVGIVTSLTSHHNASSSSAPPLWNGVMHAKVYAVYAEWREPRRRSERSFAPLLRMEDKGGIYHGECVSMIDRLK